MRVICIDASPLTEIKEGEVYTITKETVCKLGYHLLEVPDPRGFWKQRFIPLSDIDETELVNQEETTKTNI